MLRSKQETSSLRSTSTGSPAHMTCHQSCHHQGYQEPGGSISMRKSGSLSRNLIEILYALHLYPQRQTLPQPHQTHHPLSPHHPHHPHHHPGRNKEGEENIKDILFFYLQHLVLFLSAPPSPQTKKKKVKITYHTYNHLLLLAAPTSNSPSVA